MSNEITQEEGEISSVASEKLFTQQEVNDVAARVRSETARRTKANLQKEINEMYSQASRSDEKMDSSLSLQPDLEKAVASQVEKTLSGVVAEINNLEAKKAAAEVHQAFTKKMGDMPFSSEVNSILSDPDYNHEALSNIIKPLLDVDNTREVFEHLITHPGQLQLLSNCARNQSERAARLEINKLSKALRDNSKKEEGGAKEPLPKIPVYNNSGSPKSLDKDCSISDMRRFIASRR